ncbi:MAG: hypothetical protein F6K47_42540, partial [Symploca sp. SIO2E6]|nr:hypothetical protein [Symploca sp. SIO2E6]
FLLFNWGREALRGELSINTEAGGCEAGGEGGGRRFQGGSKEVRDMFLTLSIGGAKRSLGALEKHRGRRLRGCEAGGEGGVRRFQGGRK